MRSSEFSAPKPNEFAPKRPVGPLLPKVRMRARMATVRGSSRNHAHARKQINTRAQTDRARDLEEVQHFAESARGYARMRARIVSLVPERDSVSSLCPMFQCLTFQVAVPCFEFTLCSMFQVVVPCFEFTLSHVSGGCPMF